MTSLSGPWGQLTALAHIPVRGPGRPPRCVPESRRWSPDASLTSCSDPAAGGLAAGGRVRQRAVLHEVTAAGIIAIGPFSSLGGLGRAASRAFALARRSHDRLWETQVATSASVPGSTPRSMVT